jgi:hypothetical protein
MRLQPSTTHWLESSTDQYLQWASAHCTTWCAGVWVGWRQRWVEGSVEGGWQLSGQCHFVGWKQETKAEGSSLYALWSINWLTKVFTCFQLLERWPYCLSVCTATTIVSISDCRYASWLSFKPLVKSIALYLMKLHLNLWGYCTWTVLSLPFWNHELQCWAHFDALNLF